MHTFLRSVCLGLLVLFPLTVLGDVSAATGSSTSNTPAPTLSDAMRTRMDMTYARIETSLARIHSSRIRSRLITRAVASIDSILHRTRSPDMQTGLRYLRDRLMGVRHVSTQPAPAPSVTTPAPTPATSPLPSPSYDPSADQQTQTGATPPPPTPISTGTTVTPPPVQPTPSVNTGATTNGSSDPALAAMRTQMLQAINNERSLYHLPPLRLNDTLNTVAQSYSEYMYANNYFDHVMPDGTKPGDRVTKAWYVWQMTGENIAEGQTTVTWVMTDWMNSPEHRDNILRDGFTEVGIGFSHNFWTQEFGMPMAQR